MSVEIASLRIEVDATPVAAAEKALNSLTAAAARVEKATGGIKVATREIANAHAQGASANLQATQGSSAYAASLGVVERASRSAAKVSAEVRSARALEAAVMRDAVQASKAYERDMASLAARAAALKASIDPLAASIDRVNAEMKEASTLFARGAISATDYGQAQSILTARLGGLASMHGKAGTGARLQAHEVANLGAQFADVGVSLASGQALWLVAIQQGSQIGAVMGDAAARGVTFGAALSGVAAAAAPFVAALAPVLAVAGALAGVFAIGAQKINEGNKDIVAGLGLTSEQMEKVKNDSVTMGDTIKATFQVAGAAIWDAFGPQIEKVGSSIKTWYDQLIEDTVVEIKAIVGFFVGGYEAIKATWGLLPGAIGDAVVSAANFAIRAVEAMVNGAIDALNKLNPVLNALAQMAGMPGNIAELSHIKIDPIINANEGAMRSAGEVAAKAYAEGFAKGGAAVDSTFSKIATQAVKNAKERILKEAGDAKAGPKGPAAPRDVTDERTAQIDGMLQAALADELQARLGITREIEARADIERQIARAQEAVKAAQIAGRQAALDEDLQRKRITKATYDELSGQLKIVASVNARAASYREQAISEAEADAVAQRAFSITQAQADVQLRVLAGQQDIAKTEYERLALSRERLKIEQGLERSALEQTVASKTATSAQKEIAQDLLDRLAGIHGNEQDALDMRALADATNDAVRAITDIGDAVRDHDWGRLFTSLLNAVDSAITAFASAKTSADRMSATGSLFSAAGGAVGGKAGSVLGSVGAGFSAAGSAAGMAGSFGAIGGAIAGLAGPIGIAVAGFSLLSGILGDQKAKKRAKLEQEARDIENARSIAQERANKRAELEIALMEAQGNAAGALAARRAAELRAMDASNKALQEAVWATQDLAEARQKEVDAAQALVDDAHTRLTEAYDSEAGALQDYIDRFKGWSEGLNKFLKSLYSGPSAMLSPEEQYKAARSAFDSTSALAAGGDENAIRDLESVSQAYLDASKSYYASSQEYFRDLERVRSAVSATQGYAAQQVDVGQAQLTALNASVAGIINVNNSVLSVRDALAGYQAAIQQLAAAQAAQAAQQAANDNAVGGPSYEAVGFAGYVDKNSDLAALYASGGGMASGRTKEEFGAYHWNRYGQAEDRHYRPFASGGIMDRPIALGESGIGGEAGPEGILPLANVGGKMGVHATVPGNDEEKALLRELIAKQDVIISELQADKVQRAAIDEKQDKRSAAQEAETARLSRTQAARPQRAA